jgi:hypothetical protein
MPTIFDQILDEANLSQLARKQKSITKRFPDFFTNPIKVPGVIKKGGVRMSKMDKDKWHFRVHSGTEEGLWYDVVIRWKDIPKLLEKLVADRRNWTAKKDRVDLKKLAAEVFKKADVQLKCDCPADLYYGGHYIRSQGKYDAKYTEPETRPPVVRNPKEYGCYCKHTQVLMKVLPWYKGTMANWLKKNYSDIISREEEKALKVAAAAKKAAAALARRT